MHNNNIIFAHVTNNTVSITVLIKPTTFTVDWMLYRIILKVDYMIIMKAHIRYQQILPIQFNSISNHVLQV